MSGYRNAPELSTEAGAQRLAHMIREHWAQRGHKVWVQTINHGHSAHMRAAYYGLQSDLVNGLPRDWGQK